MGEQRFFHDTYNLRKAQFQKLRDCFEGQDAIREGGTTYLPSGPRIGNWPILELIDCGGNLTWHYRCENQLGTLEGMTNEEGIRVAEFDTSKYGEVYHKHILFDGRVSRIDSANWEPLSQVTHILLVPGVFFPEDVLGAVLRATNSESAATAVVRDVDVNGAYIAFDDPNGAVADIINGDGGQFLIWDNRLGAEIGYPTTGGTWTDVELYTDPQFGIRTILHCGGEDFREFMVGWQVQIDAAVPVYLDIVAVDGELLYVSGDASALVTAEETEFCIIHPVGVNPQNGATQTDPCRPESRYLWGGGYYLPPVVGFEMDHEGVFGIHGQQPGNNYSGQHYMWNRRMDIDMGKWTTTDPAARPWHILLEYCSSTPVTRTDPAGLDDSDDIDQHDGDVTVTMGTPTVVAHTTGKNKGKRQVCTTITIETDSKEMQALLPGLAKGAFVRVDKRTIENTVGSNWKYSTVCTDDKKEALQYSDAGDYKLTEVVGAGGKKHWEFTVCFDQEPCTGKACQNLDDNKKTTIEITLTVSVQTRSTIKVQKVKQPDSKFVWRSVTLSEEIEVDCTKYAQ